MPDSADVLEEGEDFHEFRLRATELIKDVVFIVGSSNVFKHMYGQLTTAAAQHQNGSAQQSSQPPWEVTEAALFVMSAVARNILPDDEESVPCVVEAVLSLPPTSHPAVRHTAFRLVGELGEWVQNHPGHLERILNWILAGQRHARHRVSSTR